MANIRVDLDHKLIDGAELAFRSPCDCSAVTGLIVYYPNSEETVVSQEFIFADAHKNDVTEISELFKEDVIVKVILDIEHNRAYVQNADTNAYLEDRFNRIESSIPSVLEFRATIPSINNTESPPWRISTLGVVQPDGNLSTKTEATNTVKVEGIRESDNPLICVDLSSISDSGTSFRLLTEWSKISLIKTRDNRLSIVCGGFDIIGECRPIIDIPILIQVNRGSSYISGGGGTRNYEDLTNKPLINGIELVGNKTSNDLRLDVAEVEVITNAELDKILV